MRKFPYAKPVYNCHHDGSMTLSLVVEVDPKTRVDVELSPADTADLIEQACGYLGWYFRNQGSKGDGRRHG